MPDKTASSLSSESTSVVDFLQPFSEIITSLGEDIANNPDPAHINNFIIDSVIGIGGDGGPGGAGGASVLGNAGAGGGGGNGGNGISATTINLTSPPNSIPFWFGLLPPFSIIITLPAATTNNPDTVIVNNFVIGSVIGIGGDSGRGGAGGASVLGSGGAGGSSGIGGNGIFTNTLNVTTPPNPIPFLSDLAPSYFSI